MVKLDKFNVIYKITFKLINETAFRIGSGDLSIHPSEPDSSVLKVKLNEKYVPFIPGSSLKGVFRSFLESYTGEKCEYCDKKATLDERKKFLQKLKEGELKLCPACRLFGNSFISGRLFFSDALPEDVEKVMTKIRDGVVIDRDTETAAEGLKYDYEVVEPGARFKVEITAVNVNEEDIELLKKVMEFINLGVVKIGGGKSRGLGKFRIENWKVEKLHENGGER